MIATNCLLALLAAAAIASTAAAQPPAKTAPAAVPRGITYADGQLRIDVVDATLAEVVAKVASLTGVKIDLPEGVDTERMPVVELGPGPARQVLADLLSDSNLDYLIQASQTDPGKMQSVLVMAREKKGAGLTMIADAGVRRNPFVRVPEQAEEQAPVEVAAPATGNQDAAVTVEPPPGQEPSAPQPAGLLPDQSGKFPLLQPDTTNPAKPGALAPPPVLNQTSMSQQLQQMYQQRVQMTQQDHYTGTQPIVLPGNRK